jgi:hypothetical protein
MDDYRNKVSIRQCYLSSPGVGIWLYSNTYPTFWMALLVSGYSTYSVDRVLVQTLQIEPLEWVCLLTGVQGRKDDSLNSIAGYGLSHRSFTILL